MLTKYEALVQAAKKDGVEVVPVDCPQAPPALYIGDPCTPLVAVRTNQTEAEAACACAEGIGLHHAGPALPRAPLERERQRRRARKWAVRELLPLDALGEAFLAHSGNAYAMAEALDVTRAFLDEAIALYAARYSGGTQTDAYAFQFHPYFDVRRR